MSRPIDDIDDLIAEALNVDAPDQVHVEAMRLWVATPGNADQLYSLVGDQHYIEAMAQVAKLSDQELSAWVRGFWRVAAGSCGQEEWGPTLLWNARRMAGVYPMFAQTLFELTKSWSRTPLLAEAFEGQWNTSLVGDDSSEPRLFLEFAIRGALEADSVESLAKAGWTVAGGNIIAYALAHGSIQTFSDLAEESEEMGAPLGFGKAELGAVQRRIESGTYRYRGVDREDVHRELNHWSGVLARKEREVLRAALDEPRKGPGRPQI